ncbi:MAG: hypothetical protein AAF465_11770 [Pseudomonadota bacterium]
MTDHHKTARAAAVKHAIWLFGAAFGIFATYLVYVYVYTINM